MSTNVNNNLFIILKYTYNNYLNTKADKKLPVPVTLVPDMGIETIHKRTNN